MKLRFNSHILRAGGLIAGLFLVLTTLAISASAASAAAGDAPMLQLGTPTPTPDGQINLPTATPTVLGGPTATPSRTPTVTPVIVRTIGDPVTNLRSAPSLDSEVLAELPPGTDLPVIGRWLGYDWFLVQWQDAPNAQAWIYKPLVIVIGDETTIPAVTPPPQPTLDPAQVDAFASATALLQTPGGDLTATALALIQPTGVYTATPPGGGSFGVIAPTFTPPPPFVQPEDLPAPEGRTRGGIPPAVLIVSLGLMGLLTLVVGLVRRI